MNQSDGRAPFLVVSLPIQHAADPAGFARLARDAGARMVEIRLDRTPGIAPFDAALPLLFSPRGAEIPGGLRQGLDGLDLDRDLDSKQPAPPPDFVPLVRSFHDHAGTPSEAELLRIGGELRQRGATLVKLAVTATSYGDLERLDAVRAALLQQGPTVVHAMGPLAELERVRSPWRNTWTYSTLDSATGSAPGQLELARHLALAAPTEPAIFGVAGSPQAVARSGGPALHNRWFAERGQHAHYLRFPLDNPVADFKALRALGVRGLSVTTPAKLAAFQASDDQDDGARATSSANTLLLGRRVRALQLDTAGIVGGYPELRGFGPVAIVGTGGVVPTVLLAGQRLGWRNVTVFGRNRERARELAGRFDARAAPLEQLGEQRPALLVWCLPMDLEDLALPNGPGRALDLRYGQTSPFLERARAAGFSGLDGQAMFEAQARAQSDAFAEAAD